MIVDGHGCHTALHFGVKAKENQDKVPTYLGDILNINTVYFDNMVSQIYHSELQLNKANASDKEAAFFDLHWSISIDIFSTKIYDNVTTLILKLSISHF